MVRCKKCYAEISFSRGYSKGICNKCMKKNEDKKKAIKTCPICHEEFDETLFNRKPNKICPTCLHKKMLEYERARREKMSEEEKEKKRQQQLTCIREKRAKKKGQGMCQSCGTRKAEPEKTLCSVCLERTRQRHKVLKAYWVKEKGDKCFKCGGSFPQEAYDFHHIDPKEKEYNIVKLMQTNNKEELEKEMTKCVLLCSNCHRTVHSKNQEKRKEG